MTIALIATVKNEAAELPAFLDSILRQTRKPDFVIITSGRSTDKTDEILQEFEDTYYDDGFVWLPLFFGDGRSFGRNEAIRFAYEEGVDIIACCNVSVLHDDWFEKIVAPFEYEGSTAVLVGGSYLIPTRNRRERAAALVTQYTRHEQMSKQFISALSMAFTTRIWRDVGGFPEELETSEDTVFVQRVREIAGEFVGYDSDALVNWRPSTLTLRGTYRTYKQFAETDRKAGIKRAQYLITAGAYLSLMLTAFALAGVLPLAIWLLWRSRKAPLLGIPYVLAVDLGRLTGYWFK